ncbi:MAG: MFS transporter [Bryobacteraceae bacterium]|nr:MFS transporter [Bryobacteraceae bacterium]
MSNGASHKHRKLAVVLAGFCAFLTLFMTQPLLPAFASIFNASKVAVSLTVTAATLGVALAAPLIGNVADKLGRKRVIVWSAYLLAISTILAATSTNLPTLIFWRLVEGVFTPGVFAITVAYIQEEWGGGGAGSATAAYVTGTVLGGFCSRLVSGFVGTHLNWQMSFVTIGVIGLLGATALLIWLPMETKFVRRGQDHTTLSASLDHLKNRRLLATFITGSCILFSLLGSFTFITFYLAAPPFSLDPAALGSLFFVYLVGAVITPNSGRIIDRFGQRLTVAFAIAFSMLGILLTLSHNLAIVIAGLAIACSGVFVAQSCSSSYIGIAAKHNKALAVGLYVTFYYIGGSIGSSVPGYLWNVGGWPACVALFVAVQFITIFIALLWWDKPVAPAREAAPVASR